MCVLKIIIVDDEVDAREVLSTLLELSSFKVDILDRCSCLLEAVSSIKKNKPDVVFLDVEMPNYAGYEIKSFLSDTNGFEIIFTTAYEKYAIKAFDLSAIDYLLKPISRTKLDKALYKVEEKITRLKKLEHYNELVTAANEDNFEHIIVPELGERRLLKVDHIVCMQGNGSYTVVHFLEGEPLTVSKTLKFFEKILPANGSFFRSQKSWIININHIKSYNQSLQDIFMITGIKARLSKGQTGAFLSKLRLGKL